MLSLFSEMEERSLQPAGGGEGWGVNSRARSPERWSQPGSRGPLKGRRAGSPASAELGHKPPGMFLASGRPPRLEHIASFLCSRCQDQPRNRLMSAGQPALLMGRKWAGALGTDEPARRALRRHSQGDGAGITHLLLMELALAQLVPAKRLRGCLGSEWGRYRGVWPSRLL